MALSLKERFNLSRFIKGEKASVESIKLTHRRIFILPTQRGLGFVVLIFILLLIAFIYNNNLAYLLAFLLASIFFITILHTFKSLAGLVLRQSHSPAAFAGDVAGFDIVIDNPAKIKRFNLKIKLDKPVDFSLPKQQQITITLYSAATSKRGWYEIGTVTLSSTYPLGFFRAWAPLRFDAKVLIYPKPSAIELPFPEAEGSQATTLENKNAKGKDDFYGINEYQKGDPIKQIHWKAYAKGQGLFSKQYSGDNLTELWLNYDLAPGHDIEERLSQLCRWVIDAEKSGLQYGFTLADVKLEPNHGKAHYNQCLEALALY